MSTSLPYAPDGIGISVVDVTATDAGWRVALAVPGDLHGPDEILQGGLSSSLPRIAAACLLDEHAAVPSRSAADITVVHARLRRPTPLSALLYADVHVEDLTDLHLEIRNGDEVCIRGVVEVGGPPPIPLLGDLAELARVPFPPPVPQESYPLCFVCGAANVRGLHLAPQPLGATGMAAAPWTPDDRVDDGHGRAHPVAVAAVLDCPGVWAGLHRIGFDDPSRQVALLADYRIQWFDSPALGAPCRTVALVDDVDERQLQVRTALYAEGGKMLALATATHIFAATMPPAPVPDRPLS